MWDKSLIQRKEEIRLLMRYAVPEGYRDQAFELLEDYDADHVGLNLLFTFYSHLPEGQDDAVLVLRMLGRRQGTFLLCATTSITDYLYVVTLEGAALLGTLAEGVQHREVLEFFGFQNDEGFAMARESLDTLPPYEAVSRDSATCPCCLAAEGEYHSLGCPVEICPWCEGQLASCDCRFSQLGLEEVEGPVDLDRLRALLEERGRIPYAVEQRPSFLTDEEE